MLGTSAVSTNVCRSNNIATRGQQHLILLAIVEGWLKLVDSTTTQKKTKSLKDTKRWICLNLVIPPSKASFPAKENNKQSVSEMEKKRTEGKKKKRCCLTERGCTHTLSGRYSNLDWAFWEPPTSDSKRTHTHTVLHSREKKKRGAREDKSNPLEGAVLYTKREWYCWFLISAI